MSFHFHRLPSLKPGEARIFPSPKCFLTRGNTAVRCRHLADRKNICTCILRTIALLLSTVFATLCQFFAVSSSCIVSHEYAKRWDCQTAKSWSRAELVQQSPSLLWRPKLLPLKVHVIYFLYQGECSVAYK